MKISGFILLIDSYLLRLGVASMLNRIQGIRVLKEFGSGDPFMAYLKGHQVDFILISQASFEGLIDQFTANPELLEKTILLKEYPDIDAHTGPSDYGVYATIHLLDDKDTVIKKITELLNHRDNSNTGSSSELSPRETTIVRLVSMGLTNREIAEKLFLSTHTVMTHRKNINSKLGIKSVSALTVYAIVNNIITLEELS